MPNGCPKGVMSRFCAMHSFESCTDAVIGLILLMAIKCEAAEMRDQKRREKTSDSQWPLARIGYPN